MGIEPDLSGFEIEAYRRMLVSTNFTIRTLRVSNIILVYECR